MITLTRITHKSTVQTESFDMDIRLEHVLAYHDGLVVVGSHQFHVAETREQIKQKISDAGGY